MDKNIEQRVYKLAQKELTNLKYLPNIYYVGLISSIFDKAGVPRVNPIPQDYFDVIKNAICEEFCGGCEPEFEDEKSWKDWEAINNENYKFVIESEVGPNSYKRSPYRDKTLPFLTCITN